MVLDVFLLLSAIYYFDNSNQNDSNGWQQYQILNATLSVSYFVPNLTIITPFSTGICWYVWKNRRSKQIHKRILGIFARYNLTKYLLQIVIGVPLYAVGFISLLPWVFLLPSAILACARNGEKCNCLPWLDHEKHIYITLIIAIYLTPYMFFVSFNFLSGHIWIVSSIRSLCAWDACYDNSIFLDVVNGEYDWIELLVYVTYWLP